MATYEYVPASGLRISVGGMGLVYSLAPIAAGGYIAWSVISSSGGLGLLLAAPLLLIPLIVFACGVAMASGSLSILNGTNWGWKCLNGSCLVALTGHAIIALFLIYLTSTVDNSTLMWWAIGADIAFATIPGLLAWLTHQEEVRLNLHL